MDETQETHAAEPGQGDGGEAWCLRCRKPVLPQDLCVCAELTQHRNRVAVLVLRHPQEKDRVLGTARLIELQLANASVVTGLSWRNLAHALGRDAKPRALDPSNWGVLYQGPKTDRPARESAGVIAVDRAGKPLADQARGLAGIRGVIVLDGTWSQAKTLWWRNPWLLKCRRLVLNPAQQSAYGRLRREPRRDSISTLEAAALAVATLERDVALYDRLVAPLRSLVARAGGDGVRTPRPSTSRG